MWYKLDFQDKWNIGVNFTDKVAHIWDFNTFKCQYLDHIDKMEALKYAYLHFNFEFGGVFY